MDGNVIPANLILIRSRGCRIRVEAMPPEMPATRCSYLMLEKKEDTRSEGVFIFVASF